MQQIEVSTINQDETKVLYLCFGIWSFILLCRPQDYFLFLRVIRPALTLGLLTLFIYLLSARKSVKITSSNQFKIYRYLIVIMIIGVPFSFYRSASLQDVLNYACITAIFFFLFYQLANTIENLRKLLFIYCVGIAIYAISTLRLGNFDSERISFGSMFDPNDLAFFIISFLTFNLLFISKDNKFSKRIIAFVNILVCLTVILKTGSRGGLIALLTVCTYLTFVSTRTLRISFIKKISLALIAIVLLQFVTMNAERYQTILDVKDDYNITDETGRIAIWKAGMRMISSHPFTGVGVGMFGEGVGKDREERGLESTRWQAPHNSLVQIGAETGVFGLLLFCLLSLNVFRITGQIIAGSQSEDLIKISEMTRIGFVGLFVSSMFLSQAYSIYWIFYIVMSAVLKYISNNEEQSVGNDQVKILDAQS